MHDTKKYYISSLKGDSGICQYSRDFFHLVLEPKGYQYLDSALNEVDILSKVASKDHVHLEIGLFQKSETQLLFLMLAAGYQHVSVTLHDAPLLKYPLHDFHNTMLHRLSKFHDKFIARHRNLIPYMRKLDKIYVLSEKGAHFLRDDFGLRNVHHLPHVIDPSIVRNDHASTGKDLLFYGFIGRNKGLEYALKLHRNLLDSFPDMKFHVVGKAMGKEAVFLDRLRSMYSKQVEYHGYATSAELESLFTRSSLLVLPFREYSFYWPVSGTILNGMARGKAILTRNVNVIGESIVHGKNGFFLSGNIPADSDLVRGLLADERLATTVRDQAMRTILEKHHPDIVSQNFQG